MVTANGTSEAESDTLRLQFDLSVELAFHGSAISSDGGLLLHRELDDAFGLGHNVVQVERVERLTLVAGPLTHHH